MKSRKPEIWKRVIVAEPLPSKHSTGNFIKSGQRGGGGGKNKKSSSKALRNVDTNAGNINTSAAAAAGPTAAASAASSDKKTKKKKARGKIILGPRLQQREKNISHHSTDGLEQEEHQVPSVLVAASQENENDADVKVIIQQDSLNDPELDGDTVDNVINVDTRKIFSLTDVTLPTPVRTRLIKRRPSSSPSSRPVASSSSRAGSGAAAAKSLRPIVVSTSTLNAALPKGDNSMLNTWFSKLEDAEQHAVSKQSEADRMSAQVGQWETKFLILKKEVRNREQVRQEEKKQRKEKKKCICNG